MRSAFEKAMLALEIAHEGYVRSQRSHAANLMALGSEVAVVDPVLGQVNELEDELRLVRESLWQEHAQEEAEAA